MKQLDRRWKVLLVTAVAVFMAFLDVTIVNVAFPSIEAAFPTSSLAELSWVLNAYNIVFAALLVPAGRLADLLGRRRMFFVGLGLFMAASALCGLRRRRGRWWRRACCRRRARRCWCRRRWGCCCPSSRLSGGRRRRRCGARWAPSRRRRGRRWAGC